MKYSRRPVALALCLLSFAAIACSGQASFQGTVLAPADAAPPFQLHDQFGASVALDEMAGNVVVLTFLYTYCPDICPIVTETLRSAHALLGDDADQVEFVAVSVDPKRDSVERAYQYSLEKDMENRWRFLVGSEEKLKSIWRSYWIDPAIAVPGVEDGSNSDDHGDGDHGGESKFTTIATTPASANGYLVDHNPPVFLIDRDGLRRIVFTQQPWTPKAWYTTFGCLLSNPVAILNDHGLNEGSF